MRISHVPVFLLAIMLSSCNFFSPIDSPSGDEQHLSAARACFDRGDFTCASKHYGELSTASSDNANSEDAFAILDQNGASMSAFMKAAVGQSSSGGKFITKLAANMATANRGATTRLNIFHAFQKTSLINNASVKGLVRFITASAFLAEILAENSATLGTFKKTDLVTDSAACSTALIDFTPCTGPSHDKFIDGTALDLNTTTDAVIISTAPTLYMILAAVTEIRLGISQMKATGSLGTSTDSFASQVETAATSITTESRTFRKALINLDLGD